MFQVPGENWQARLGRLDGKRLLAVTEDIGQEPNGILLDELAMFGVEQANDAFQDSGADKLVSALDGIAGDIAESPDDVVLDFVYAIFVEQLVELRKALAEDEFRMRRFAGGDVCKAPDNFALRENN